MGRRLLNGCSVKQKVTFCIKVNKSYSLFTDVTELQTLIGLSVGKDDDNDGTMDPIAQLHTVGSAIAPLVYELKKDSNLPEFVKACEPVWKSMKEIPKLSELLVSGMFSYFL